MTAQAPRTLWGGLADGLNKPNGFFRVGQSGGVFWLIDPVGGRFLSKGVNTVRFDQDEIRNTTRIPYAEACQRKYGGKDAWRATVAERLSGWGFNTLGSWSDEAVAAAGRTPLAVTPNLDLGMSFAWQKNQKTTDEHRQEFPDVFDTDFERHIQRRARDMCAARSNEPGIIGWFIDNELRWGPDWRGPDELLTLFLNLPIASPGRVAAIAFLRERHYDCETFNASWRTPARSWTELGTVAKIDAPYRRGPPYERNVAVEDDANRIDSRRATFAADCDAFLALVAERYFALTATAIKAADGNHLVLGSRFAYPPPASVIAAAGRHADVVSFNCYGDDPSDAIDIYAVTGKPSLIGEFSFRAADSGLPNTEGAAPKVATQAERAARFRHYAEAALRKPTIVGYHWFEHADQPAEGRFDGENSNYGTVTIEDCIYDELTHAMTAISGAADDLHAAAASAT